MWQCFDKTENPKILSAFLIERYPTEEKEKLSFICPKCKEPLSFISKYSKQKGIVRSHFAHKSNSECNWIPEGESEKHYNLKFNLLDQLTNETIKIKVGNLVFETSTKDYNIDFAETELKAITERRADILLKLKNPNPIFGLGIAIEIRVTENEESIKQKSKDYAVKGYSVATTKEGETIEILQTYPQIVLEIFKYNFERLKQQEEIIRQIDSSFLMRANKHGWDCTTCAKARKSNKHDGFIVCFKNWNNTTRTGNIEEKADIVPCEKYYPSKREPILLAEPELEVECTRGDEQ